MNSQQQLVVLTTEQLQELVRHAVRTEFEEFFKSLQPQPKEEPYLSIREVCKLLNVSQATIHAWKKAGKLTFHRLGSRTYYLESEVRACMQTVNSRACTPTINRRHIN